MMHVNQPAQPFLLIFVFAVVCVMSAIALVYTKHESRKLFVELEQLTHERDGLNIEPKGRRHWFLHGRGSFDTCCCLRKRDRCRR